MADNPFDSISDEDLEAERRRRRAKANRTHRVWEVDHDTFLEFFSKGDDDEEDDEEKPPRKKASGENVKRGYFG